jgi:hypothetical protein
VTANTIGVAGLPNARLSARLTSLTELTKIGFARTDGFSTELLTEAELLLRRSGERPSRGGRAAASPRCSTPCRELIFRRPA